MTITKIAVPKDVQKAVLKKTNNRCTYCDIALDPKQYGTCKSDPKPGAWEADHWIPDSVGGSDDTWNRWPACCDCNDAKDDTTGEEYFAKRQKDGDTVSPRRKEYEKRHREETPSEDAELNKRSGAAVDGFLGDPPPVRGGVPLTPVGNPKKK